MHPLWGAFFLPYGVLQKLDRQCAYVETSRQNEVSKRHFVLSAERFSTKEEALKAALEEGRRLIDEGFDPEQMG